MIKHNLSSPIKKGRAGFPWDEESIIDAKDKATVSNRRLRGRYYE